MKPTFFIVFLLVSFPLTAQNLQLHYDFGKDRKFFTATLEMFKPDTLGSTYWFVDFDHNSGFGYELRSMSSAYWEISREFYIPGIKKIKGLKGTVLFHFFSPPGPAVSPSVITWSLAIAFSLSVN